MNVEMRTLMFDHLLVYETTQAKEDWLDGFGMMENFILTEEIYKNGPVFFSVAANQEQVGKDHFTYYLPINEAVRLSDETDFRYLDHFKIDNALVLRQANEEADFSTAYQNLKAYAAEHKIEIEDTYYCVMLEVYGEYIIELFVPIKEVER